MDYRRQLEEHFESRKKQNPVYSLRAFARDLGLHPSTLSKILSAKRNVPFSVLESVTERLHLNQEEKVQFFTSVLHTRGFGGSQKLAWPTTEPEAKVISNDLHFQIISEWEFYAVLNLMKLKDFRSDIVWISDRLGITHGRCKKVIDILLKTRMIYMDSEDQFIRTYSKLTTSDDVSSAALKMSHQSDLKLAALKIWNTAINKRDFCSMVMPINVKNLKKAKLLTRNYFKEMEKLLESGDLTEVYQLSVQLFPLSTSFKETLRRIRQ